MNKKIMAGILALATLAQGAAFAEEGIMLISENPISAEEKVSTYDKVQLIGTLEKNEDGIFLKDGEEEIQLNTDENTFFVGNGGTPISADEIANGTGVLVIASEAMTKSLPPQTYAYAVMAADENGGFPIYVEVSDISKDGDNYEALSADGNYRIVFTDETQVVPFATKNIVKAVDIAKGSRLLVSSDIMTMSIPAVVPAEKIVLLPEAYEAESDNAEKIPSSIILNGKSFETAEIKEKMFEQDGVYFLPLRAICEAAGLDVEWNDAKKAVTVGTVQMGVTLNIGVNKYTKAKMMAAELSSAPILVNDTTFVPVDFFTDILEAEANVVDGEISVNLK